jgi:hypothetical protein
MLSKGEKSQELLLNGSNYKSWCNSILDALTAIDPILLSIIDASIFPQILIGKISPMRKENACNTMLKQLVY